MIEVFGARRDGRQIVLEVAVEGSDVWFRRKGESEWTEMPIAVVDEFCARLVQGVRDVLEQRVAS